MDQLLQRNMTVKMRTPNFIIVFSNHFPDKKELESDRLKIFSIINSELQENEKMKSLDQYDSDCDYDINREINRSNLQKSIHQWLFQILIEKLIEEIYMHFNKPMVIEEALSSIDSYYFT